MTMQETWKFQKILVHPTEGSLSNVIVTIEFIYGLSDGRSWEQYNGSTTLSSPTAGPGFIDYEDITYEEMITLTKTGLGDDYDDIKAQLTAALANPLIPLSPPWIEEISEEVLNEDAFPDDEELVSV